MDPCALLKHGNSDEELEQTTIYGMGYTTSKQWKNTERQESRARGWRTFDEILVMDGRAIRGVSWICW